MTTRPKGGRTFAPSGHLPLPDETIIADTCPRLELGFRTIDLGLTIGVKVIRVMVKTLRLGLRVRVIS